MRSWYFILFVIVAGGVICAVSLIGSKDSTTQPIQFNHKRHIEEGMNCVDCHKQVEKGIHATIPNLKQCLLCHSDPQGSNKDEPKIREYAQRGEEIPWIQVNRLPGHVYFSHRVHIVMAKMDCSECHGDMKGRTNPVTSSQIEHLSMDKCMECHKQYNVSNDCLRCHK